MNSTCLCLQVIFLICMMQAWIGDSVYHRFPKCAFLAKGSPILFHKPTGIKPATKSHSRNEHKVSKIAKSASGLLDEDWEDVEARPRLSRVMDLIVRRVVTSRTKSHLNLNVTCFSPSTRKLLSGFLPNVNITFDELYFDKVQITGGATIQALGSDFKMLAFPLKPFFRQSRALKKPMEVYGEIYLTQEDVVESPAIRKTAQNLINILVQKALKMLPQFSEVLAVAVKRVAIQGKRLAFSGTVNTAVTNSIPFCVKTGLRIRESGHVVILDKPELVVNAGTALELKVPILASGEIEIDIGNSAKLERVEIDNGKIGVEARVLFSPVPPFAVSQTQQRAVYSYDLGSFLSEVW
eukprot:CAMPEP_0117755188 /NCGR_PEP_ID=MMETSP0947-20121206/13297_1 /TAXON_ID=44440 /ORGANISM="Chattonella subsalsa, Strain CCMP2191" /LENGTH=351 /DNA_ID=CAMNT_0005574463 /DNA_START=162 /DNA_END=1214 /DNA_ORIENTATION=+